MKRLMLEIPLTREEKTDSELTLDTMHRQTTFDIRVTSTLDMCQVFMRMHSSKHSTHNVGGTEGMDHDKKNG